MTVKLLNIILIHQLMANTNKAEHQACLAEWYRDIRKSPQHAPTVYVCDAPTYQSDCADCLFGQDDGAYNLPTLINIQRALDGREDI